MRTIRTSTLLRKALILGSTLLVVLGFLLVHETKTAHAACSMGDIICEMQQAIQQLIDSYINPLKEWATFEANKTFSTIYYDVVKNVAVALWGLSKALTTVGVGIGVLNDWISTNFLQPMITTSNQAFQPVISLVFIIALFVIGISYMLAVFMHIRVVSPRSAILWYVAAILFFQNGPTFYSWMREFRQMTFAYFYASSLDAVQNQSPFDNLANGDDSKGSPVYGMSTPCNNFSIYLPGSAGAINGLDIALAYQKADGFDVNNKGTKCLGGGSQQELPRRWLVQDGYFDPNIGPNTWIMNGSLDAARATMKTTTDQATAGLSRLFNSTPLVWFGIIEQLVSLCLTIAQGLTFISFSCALLFSFFKATEAIAWVIVRQWLELFIQTIVVAVVQAMVVALFISASYTGSPLITLAVSVAGSVFMGILLVSGIKSIWNAINRLFEAFSQATGGVVVSPGAAAQTAGSLALTATSMVVTGGAAAVGAGVAGAAALGAVKDGATVAQAAGLAFGDNHAFTNAASRLYRLPALRGSSLGQAAEQFMEGAQLRGLADGLPGGDMFSPLIGARFLTNRDPNIDAERTPMLKAGMEETMTKFISNPKWKRNTQDTDEDTGEDSNDLRLQYRKRHWGTFTPSSPTDPSDDPDAEKREKGFAPHKIWDTSGSENDAPDNIGIRADKSDLDEQIQADTKSALSGVAGQNNTQASTQLNDVAARFSDSATQTAQAARALGDSGRELQRAGQQSETNNRMQMVEGTLKTSGTDNVAAVMGDLVALLQQQKADAGIKGTAAVTGMAVGNGMAEVMGLTPLGDGKPPVRQDLGRFQQYADQAMKMGLNGNTAEFVALDAQRHGDLLPQTRSAVMTQTNAANPAWRPERVEREMQTLQTRAMMLPNEIQAVGVMPAWNTPPEIKAAAETRLTEATAVQPQPKSRIPIPRPPISPKLGE